MNRVFFNIITVLFLFIFNSLPAIAQEAEALSQPITLEDAWLQMEKKSPVLRILLIDQEATLRDINSKEYLIPGIGISSSISRTSPLISSISNHENENTPEGDNWSLRGGFDLRLSIKTNLKLEDQIKVIQYNMLLLQKEIKIRDLRAGLKKLYYQISAGEKTIQLQERILGLSQSRFEQIELLYNKGLRSEFEVLNARISVARDQPSLKKAHIDQEKRFILFRELLGLKPHQEVNLIYPSDNDSDINLDPNQQYFDLGNNEEYKMELMQLELARKNRELLKKSQKSPSLGLTLGWSTSLNPLFNSETWTADDWRDSMGLGFSFSLPLDSLIKGSKGQTDLLKLDDVIKKVEINLEDSERKMFDSILSLLLDLDFSKSNVTVNELNIKLQEDNFTKIQTNYENGRTSLQELDNSRQELQKALVTLENEKLNINLLLIEIEKIIGSS